MAGTDIKYGWREGSGKGKEVPLAADQYFHRLGGHFVNINAAGHVYLATLNATHVFGWAETGKDIAGKDSWKGSATAGADKVFVLYGTEDVFELPLSATSGAANATLIGKGADIQANVTATYNNIQKAYYRATAASCLFTIVDFDSVASTVKVKIRPAKQVSP